MAAVASPEELGIQLSKRPFVLSCVAAAYLKLSVEVSNPYNSLWEPVVEPFELRGDFAAVDAFHPMLPMLAYREGIACQLDAMERNVDRTLLAEERLRARSRLAPDEAAARELISEKAVQLSSIATKSGGGGTRASAS